MFLLRDYLQQETAIERAQKKSGTHIPDYGRTNTTTPHLTNDLFLSNREVYMSKHNRYAPYPRHTHQFLELNYIVQGSCDQVINGTPYTFHNGDLLLMDVGSSHQISALQAEDLMVNIVFKDSQISLQTLEQLHGRNSLVYQFLLKSHAHLNSEENFLILRQEQLKRAPGILEQMMTEYFDPHSFSQDILTHYLAILLLDLARSLPTIDNVVQTSHDPYLQTLKLIDEQYQTLTLTQAADNLRFNKNYLSNLIKERSGVTFTHLLNQKKIMTAKLLLTSTDLPIEAIAIQVGYSNKTYFYKKFKEETGQLPSQLRQ